MQHQEGSITDRSGGEFRSASFGFSSENRTQRAAAYSDQLAALRQNANIQRIK
jgi:hypothetical protein